MIRRKCSTEGERRAAVYLLDAVGLTDAEVALIVGRNEWTVRAWRRSASVPDKRGRPSELARERFQSVKRWLANVAVA